MGALSGIVRALPLLAAFGTFGRHGHGPAGATVVLHIEAGSYAIHDLRHTHAALLREAGVDIEVISQRLGYASIAQTLKLYGHVTPKLRRTAATTVGTILDGPHSTSPPNWPRPLDADSSVTSSTV